MSLDGSNTSKDIAGDPWGSGFDALLASSMDALLVERPDGRLLRANPAACELFGLDAAELPSGGCAALIDPQDPRAAALFALREQAGMARGGLRLRRADGSLFEAEISTALFRSPGGEPCASIYIHDLTRRQASERQAREAQEQMGFALDAAELGYWTFDLESDQGYRSASMFRGLGYAQPVPGWSHDDFLRQVHPEDRAGMDAAYEAARTGGGKYEAEFRVIWPDGSIHWLSARGRFFYDGQGRALRMSGVQFDITQRRLAELELARSQARFKNLIDLSEDGILIHSDRKIRYANQAAARLLGMPGPDALVGRHLPDFIVPEMRALAIQRRDQLTAHGGAAAYMETRMTRVDGRVIDVEIAGSAVLEDGVPTIHTQLRDIAERKRHEREILALNHSLEMRVEARTRELEAANRELESYSYMVAHDLRSPLRAISGFSGMLKEALSGKLAEEEERYLGFILSNVERMNKLIDGLLQFSRSGRGNLARQRVDARALVEAVTHDQQGRGKARFEVGALPQLYADPVLLHQIFVNLIDNAVKYSRGQAEPKVEISAGEEDGCDVICIKDNGVGFEPDYAHKLFGVFQRLHAQSEFEGTGVGLAIVRKIVERHGGRVWAEGAVNQGARFCFSLPREAAAG
jgi:PAS domain S-box-containing protein